MGIVVSVLEEVNMELRAIASSPVSSNIFVVPRFSQLPQLVDKVIGSTCDTQDECISNPCRNNGQCVNGLSQFLCFCSEEYTGARCERRCRKPMDVSFVLDASGSIDNAFDMSMKLAKRIVEGLNFAGSRTRVAMLTYSDYPQVRFHLN